MNIENKVPAIRFKGFSREWKCRPFLSNFEKIIDFRGRTPKKLGLEWSQEGYLALSALNVKNGFIDFNVDAKFGNKELYEKWMSGNELHQNQVLFTNVAQIPDNKKYILSQRTIAFEVNPKLIQETFLAKLLSTSFVQRKLSSFASGGTAQGVSQKSLANLDVIMPIEITEQIKIGNYVQQIDTLIAQHQQKHDKLFNLKQSLLEKMFPKQGEKEPEIRFKGFSGEWTTSFLSDLCEETYGGGTPSTAISTYWDGDIPWIQSSDLSEEQIVEVNPRKHISERGLKNSATKLIPEESIAIVTRVGVGKISLMQKRYATSQDFLSLSKLKVSPLYGVYSIWRMLQREKITAQGTSIKGITKDELLSKIIDLPISALEQAKIGNLFKQFDSLLNKHQVQLKKLNNIKQACLEKMFV